MEPQKISELVEKYNAGLADPAEVQHLEHLLQEGQVELTQLRNLDKLEQQILQMEPPKTTLRLDDGFYAMLLREKNKKSGSFSLSLPAWNWFAPRLAFTLVVLIAGFAGGYVLKQPEKTEVAQLTREVGELKEMMMFSLLEKESASERLKAVSLTTEMDQVSQKVTQALLQTLNQDENVNVRLAALEALKPYSRESRVREELIRSIGRQDSPLVQVALAELMATLLEKRSVGELEKLLKSEKTPLDVKNKIKESLEILI